MPYFEHVGIMRAVHIFKMTEFYTREYNVFFYPMPLTQSGLRKEVIFSLEKYTA